MINSSISSSGIRQAAQRCEGDTIGRLAINTSAACDGIASTVRDTVTVVSDTVRAVGLKAKTVCNSRDKRLAWQYDELDAAKALLEGFERQLSVHISEESDFEASMRTARLLLDHVTFLPSLSVALFPGVSAPFVSEVSRMSRVQKDADSANSSVSSPHLWRRGERAKVSVCCRDALGEGLRTVTVDDVSVVEPGVGWCVGPSTVEAGTIVVEVTRAMDAEHHENPTPTLRVFVGCSPIDVPLQAGPSIAGTHVSTLRVGSQGNNGLAISPDGVMVSTNVARHTVSVHSLSDGLIQATFGGKGSAAGRFSWPQKLCFASNGNILISDCSNHRVQEITLAGAHVRAIGVGIISGDIIGIGACEDTIVVGAEGAYGDQVWVFDMASGDRVRSFGQKGQAEGQLSNISGLRLTPDGGHILFAETGNKRLSLFTLTGEFVRCIGVGALEGPTDVDFAPSGDILVSDARAVRVFSPDGSSLLRSFTVHEIVGTLQSSVALAVHAGRLYVLEFDVPRLHVFK